MSLLTCLINLKLNVLISLENKILLTPPLLLNIRSQGGRVEMHKAGYEDMWLKKKKTKCIMILIRFRAKLGNDNILVLPFAKLNLTAKFIKNFI